MVKARIGAGSGSFTAFKVYLTAIEEAFGADIDDGISSKFMVTHRMKVKRAILRLSVSDVKRKQLAAILIRISFQRPTSNARILQ